MNWDTIEGQWKQLQGSARQNFAKLTDDDLEYIAGSRDKMAGKIQERYGVERDEAHAKIDEWASKN